MHKRFWIFLWEKKTSTIYFKTYIPDILSLLLETLLHSADPHFLQELFKKTSGWRVKVETSVKASCSEHTCTIQHIKLIRNASLKKLIVCY